MSDIILFTVLGLYAGLLLLDVVRPARRFPKLARWRLKGIAFFALFFVLSSALPLVWDAWLAEYRLFDATGLGVVGGAVVGLLTVQLIQYWWHRALHRVPFLWRWFHQLHHSAERVDVYGAFYFHPLDVAGFSLVSSLGLVLVVGVQAEAAVLAGAFGLFCSFFQHSNIRTPRWLGYLIQRPENHSIHHERGVHAFNYGDIALWDMVFGTWRNPATWEGEAGFYDGASTRLGALLTGRDVTAPEAEDARALAS